MNLQLTNARKWFLEGTTQAGRFVAAWKKAKAHVADAGFCFIKARELCPAGEWELMLGHNAAQIRPRTVRFYIQLTEAAIAWVREDEPGIPESKLQSAVREVMIKSPKPLVALLRDLREMRPFGEYDAVKYAARKRLGDGEQMELDFGTLVKSIESLDRMDEASFSFLLPEGKSEPEALEELEQKLESVLAKLKARRQTVDV